MSVDKVKKNFKQEQEESKRASQIIIKPKPGFTWNPLLRLPRNLPCPCRSGKKFKTCHLNKLPQVVPQNVADSYEQAMKLPGGPTFVTQENEKELLPPEMQSDHEAKDGSDEAAS